MTRLDPTALRALLAAATPRPWRVHRSMSGYCDVIADHRRFDDTQVVVAVDLHTKEAELITAAVNSLEPLLAVYEAALAWHDCDTNCASALRDLATAIDRARGGK